MSAGTETLCDCPPDTASFSIPGFGHTAANVMGGTAPKLSNSASEIDFNLIRGMEDPYGQLDLGTGFNAYGSLVDYGQSSKDFLMNTAGYVEAPRPGGLAPNDSASSTEESVVQPGSQIPEIAAELEGELIKDMTVPPHPGGYSLVYKGTWRRLGLPDEKVAIKCLISTHMGGTVTEVEKRKRNDIRLRRETIVWQRTKHPNILPFHGYKSTLEQCLVSPWCENSNLPKYLNKHPKPSVPERLHLLKQAAQGLAHLHTLEPPIAHGALHIDDILINDKGESALVDFGLSRIIASLELRTGLTTSGRGVGVRGYSSPEILNGELPSLASDVYAFGSLILAVLTGHTPFWKLRAPAPALAAVISGKIPEYEDHPELPASDSLWLLMKQCWQWDPSKRPSVPTIISKLEERIRVAANDSQGTKFASSGSSARDSWFGEQLGVEVRPSTPSLPLGETAMKSYVSGEAPELPSVPVLLALTSVPQAVPPLVSAQATGSSFASGGLSPDISIDDTFNRPSGDGKRKRSEEASDMKGRLGQKKPIVPTAKANLERKLSALRNQYDELLALKNPHSDPPVAELRLSSAQRTTRRAMNNQTGEAVAVKPLHSNSTGEGIPDRLISELKGVFPAWQKLEHRRIHPLLGYIVEEARVSIVSRWVNNGNLREFIQANPDVDRLNLLVQIAEGLAHLHSQEPPAIHGGIKHENIFIDSDKEAVLGETGLAVFFERTGCVIYGKPEDGRRYAPEYLESGKHTMEADIYAFGCLAMEVLTNEKPYGKLKTTSAVLRAATLGQAAFSSESLTSSVSVLKVVQKCLEKDPEKRPSAQEVMESWQRLKFPLPALPSGHRLSRPDLSVEAPEVIDPESLEFNPVPFSCGTYADVHTGYWCPPGQNDQIKVAIKAFRTGEEPLSRVGKYIHRELDIWQRLHHPHVTKLLGIMTASNAITPGHSICMISPFREKGNLYTYLEHHPDVDKIALLLEAADGLEYLHTFQPCPIAHLDIKPQNILVDDNGHVELCDFGISKMIDEVSIGISASEDTNGGTIPYTSPEQLGSESGGSTASDVYAFGCLVLQTLSGQAPFYKITSKAQMVMKLARGKKAERRDHPIDGRPEALDLLWELLSRCWLLDPAERPVMAEVIKDLLVIQDLMKSRGPAATRGVSGFAATGETHAPEVA